MAICSAGAPRTGGGARATVVEGDFDGCKSKPRRLVRQPVLSQSLDA